MEKSRNFIVVLIVLAFVFCHSSKKEKTDKKAEIPDIDNDRFHLVYYTKPSTDCLECVHIALDTLKAHYGEKDKVLIFALRTFLDEDYHSYIDKNFSNVKIFILKESLNIPHPSILLIKNKKVYMYFYISPDPAELAKSIEEGLELLTELRETENGT